MAVYRCIQSVSGRGVLKIGQISRFDWLDAETITLLINRQVIARIAPPVIAKLPTWSERAPILATAGVLDGEQLIEADAQALATALGLEQGVILDWKAEMIKLVELPDRKHCGCREL